MNDDLRDKLQTARSASLEAQIREFLLEYKLLPTFELESLTNLPGRVILGILDLAYAGMESLDGARRPPQPRDS